MKRNFYKLLCLSLSFAMLLVMFAGCGKEPVSSPTDVTPQSAVTPLDKESVEDTTTTVSEGETSQSSVSKEETNESFVSKTPIASVDKVPSSTPSKEESNPIHIVFQSIYSEQYTGETGIGKLWKDHFGKMEQQGIFTSYSDLDKDTAVFRISTAVLSGRIVADVYEVSLGMSHQLAVRKVLANLFESKTLNQKAFNNGGTHSNTINGKTYGVSLRANTEVPMILYNEELVKKYAPDVDISALIAQNKWNYDTFRDLAKKCTVDTDGDGRNNVFGVTSGAQLIDGMVFSQIGGYAVEQNGKITSPLVYPGKGFETLEFARTLFIADKTWAYRSDVETMWNMFANQQAGMVLFSAKDVAKYAGKISFDYGIAPLPTKDQTTTPCGITDAKVFVVLDDKENRLNDIGKWLNGVAKAENVLLANQTYGMHGEAVRMYQQLLKNTSAEYSAGVISYNVIVQIRGVATISHIHSKEMMFHSIHSNLQQELGKFYAPLYPK